MTGTGDGAGYKEKSHKMNTSKLAAGVVTTALVALVALDIGTAAAAPAPRHAIVPAVEIIPAIIPGPVHAPPANAGIPSTVAGSKRGPDASTNRKPRSVKAATSRGPNRDKSLEPAWSSRLSGLPQGGAGLYS
ncbi:MAG TPA: hypothetical protein VEJ84_08890 [Acidimicrobiales bacterium]|nr:hypothetical protein [Acidimicrobiales bacterium]